MPTLYDYYFDMEKMNWIAWDWIVPKYVHDRQKKFTEILVPTIDTMRITWVLKLMNSVSSFICHSDFENHIDFLETSRTISVH